MPRKTDSIFLTVCTYFTNSTSPALYDLLMWFAITCETILISTPWIESAWSLISEAENYGFIISLLLVHWNSNLATYLILIPEGDDINVTAPAPIVPQAPCECITEASFGTSIAHSAMVRIQSTMKSVNACDLLVVLLVICPRAHHHNTD
jgi:hypothetical protein